MARHYQLEIQFLLFYCLVQVANSVFFIPGENCGITQEIRSLKHLPVDFDGDFSGLDCTILKASIPEWKYSAWSECSATCGGGTKHRKTECRDNLGKIYKAVSCGDGYQTQDSTCNEQLCREPDYTKMVFFRGITEASGTLYANMVDVMTLSGRDCGNLPSHTWARHARVAVFYQGSIVTCSGYRSSTENRECHRYDPADRKWVRFASLKNYANQFRKASVINGEIFFTGRMGTDGMTEVWDGAKMIPGPTSPLHDVKYRHCQVAINETHVFQAQLDADYGDGESYLLNWNTKEWTAVPSMPQDQVEGCLYSHCGLAHSDDRGTEVMVLCARGCLAYNLGSNSWRAGPGYPSSSVDLKQMAVVQLTSTFFFLGQKGRTWKYNPAEDIYERLSWEVEMQTNFPTAVAVPDDLVSC